MGHNNRGLGVIDWMTRALTLIITISVVGGIAAAAVGGSLTDLGSGYGGLYGVPDISLSAVALFMGIPAAVIIRRRLGPETGRMRIAVLVIGGVWVVAFGYSMVAHMTDPCDNGWFDAQSQIGSQPLCERFGSELSWNTRFHLLAHAAPAAVLLGVYIYIIKRWAQPKGFDTDKKTEPPFCHPVL